MEMLPSFPERHSEGPEPPPTLSVIIAAYQAEPFLGACLQSLHTQSTNHVFEVILVLSGDDGTCVTEAEYGEVRVLRSARRMYCGEARNRGIEMARGRLIAFLDADCSVLPDWVEKVIEAHEDRHLLIGGVIFNGAQHDILAWAYYFCEFSLWFPGIEGKAEVDETAGCCLSMKREAFDRFGPFLEGTYCSDSAFQWKMNRAGHRVLLCPSIRVYHSASHCLASFLEHIVEHRRCFARVCLQQGRVGKRVAGAWLLLGPLLPFLLFLAITWRVTLAGALSLPFLRSLPWILAGCVARAFGEMKGAWQELFASSKGDRGTICSTTRSRTRRYPRLPTRGGVGGE
jgi:GT2 family glycosyltransferase